MNNIEWAAVNFGKLLSEFSKEKFTVRGTESQ